MIIGFTFVIGLIAAIFIFGNIFVEDLEEDIKIENLAPHKINKDIPFQPLSISISSN